MPIDDSELMRIIEPAAIGTANTENYSKKYFNTQLWLTNLPHL